MGPWTNQGPTQRRPCLPAAAWDPGREIRSTTLQRRAEDRGRPQGGSGQRIEAQREVRRRGPRRRARSVARSVEGGGDVNAVRSRERTDEDRLPRTRQERPRGAASDDVVQVDGYDDAGSAAELVQHEGGLDGRGSAESGAPGGAGDGYDDRVGGGVGLAAEEERTASRERGEREERTMRRFHSVSPFGYYRSASRAEGRDTGSGRVVVMLRDRNRSLGRGG